MCITERSNIRKSVGPDTPKLQQCQRPSVRDAGSDPLIASGETGIPRLSEHVESSAWLSREFLGVEVHIEGHELIVKGIGFRARST